MEKSIEDALSFYQQYTAGVDIAVVCLLLIVLIRLPWYKVGNWKWLNASPRRRGKMLRRQRRRFVERDAIDGFTSFVEDRVYNLQWSRSEAKEIYRRLKIGFPVRDLFPSPELLKEAIRKRLASGIHDPVKLPGGTPKKRHIFDKV